MVQIRDSLPLIDGNNACVDSASMAADMTAHLSDTPDTQKNNTPTSPISDSSYNQHIYEDNIDINQWLDNVKSRIGQPDLSRLEQACHFVKACANQAHKARSGAFATGIAMADILAYLFPDETALTAAMLYRAVRRNLITLDSVQLKFGQEVASLVADTLAMGQLSENIEKNDRLEDYFKNNQREQLSNIYSMLISTTNDVRAVLIKLAERTFAMRELKFADESRQKRVAQEVMTIYAPLAHRLGIAQLKWELEDLAFCYLEPVEYKRIAKLLSEKRSEREAYILLVEQNLSNALKNAGIQAEVSGRVKHIYSIWRKMKKKNLSFDQLYDIRALRVLVNNNAECYYTLGIVHGIWRHIPEQFDDYITNPKPNGYKSLHTAVIAENRTLEVQIRTQDMHFEAELGMCAHVNYKEGGKNKKDDYLTQKISSLRQLLSGDKADDDELDPDETSLIDDKRIYLFSRDGDIIELPKGATVLDFAYHVHTVIGNQAVGARVNGRFVPLTHQPKTGEQVEIVTKSGKEPNRDWLIPSLGYIYTNRAKTKLRGYFNKLDRDKNIDAGKHILNREFGRLSLGEPNIGEIIKETNAKGADELYLGLITGEISLTAITAPRLDALQKKSLEDVRQIIKKPTARQSKFKIDIDGLDNVDIHLAKCCNPIHGEPIAGFITQSSGVSIHKLLCKEYQKMITDEPLRAVCASWQSDFGRYQPVMIYIEAYDRRGLLRDLTGVIDKENVNISKAETLSTDDNIAHMKFAVEVANVSHLSRLLAKLESEPSVIHARRYAS